MVGLHKYLANYVFLRMPPRSAAREGDHPFMPPWPSFGSSEKTRLVKRAQCPNQDPPLKPVGSAASASGYGGTGPDRKTSQARKSPTATRLFFRGQSYPLGPAHRQAGPNASLGSRTSPGRFDRLALLFCPLPEPPCRPWVWEDPAASVCLYTSIPLNSGSSSSVSVVRFGPVGPVPKSPESRVAICVVDRLVHWNQFEG
jgi:hypothetical protein